MLPGSRVFGASEALGASSVILRAAAVGKASAAVAAPPTVAPPAVAATEDEDEEATYQCPFSKKLFKSRAAFENYKQSKKYKTLAACAHKGRAYMGVHGCENKDVRAYV